MFVQRGQKVLVHCHAGMGRTAIICASYLVYSGECQEGAEAVKLVKNQRVGSLKNALTHKKAEAYIIAFCESLKEARRALYPQGHSLDELMDSQSFNCHGVKNLPYQYYPKVLGVCFERCKSGTEKISLKVDEAKVAEVREKFMPLVQANQWDELFKADQSEAIAIINDFLTTLRVEQAKDKNFFGLLYWAALMAPLLDEESKRMLVDNLVRVSG